MQKKKQNQDTQVKHIEELPVYVNATFTLWLREAPGQPSIFCFTDSRSLPDFVMIWSWSCVTGLRVAFCLLKLECPKLPFKTEMNRKLPLEQVQNALSAAVRTDFVG